MVKYKSHYACFNCCKTFKRKLWSDIRKGKEVEGAKCPDCAEFMADMGKDFEAPKKTDKKAWEHIKKLYSVGITFHSCGCTGPGYIPNSTEMLIVHFEKIKKNYECQLDFWRNKKEPQTKQEIHRDYNKNWYEIRQIPDELTEKKGKFVSNENAIKYWIGRIKEINQTINQLKIG